MKEIHAGPDSLLLRGMRRWPVRPLAMTRQLRRGMLWGAILSVGIWLILGLTLALSLH
jgi:hypothetical protein